jgi:exodeoxyribonuclease V alpha subunit
MDGAHARDTVGFGRYSPAMQQTRAVPATLDAVLERITYANQDTGYTGARVATDRSSDLLTVVGALLGAGHWDASQDLARQFEQAFHPLG